MLFVVSVLDDNGVVSLSSSATPAVFIHGQGYDITGAEACATFDAPAATDSFIGGFRYTATGQLQIHDATAGLPVYVTYNQGFAVNEDGEICYTSDAYDANDAVSICGVAATLDGRLYANVQ